MVEPQINNNRTSTAISQWQFGFLAIITSALQNNKTRTITRDR